MMLLKKFLEQQKSTIINTMPELPEVETVRQTLRANILGKEIVGIKVLYERMILGHSKEEFINNLIGKKLNEIGRLGKYLYFEFSDDVYLISHLRMEGKYFIKPISDEIVKHEHIIIEFSDGLSLRYHDTRKFGTMELRNKEMLFITHPLASLGKEAYELDFDYLKEKTKGRHRDLKAFLLDQTVIAGIGNIYADEVCFEAKLNPKQDIYYLSDCDLVNIAEASKKVINNAIKAGGTTIRSYTSSLGVTGLFQLQLNVHTKKGEPCPICGNIITKTRVAGRGTYLCEVCQKIKN